MPVTERLGFGLGETAEQAVQTHPNDDEERLEQMVHPKKPRVRGTLLERWNGLAWVCTPLAMENGLAGVCMEWLWKGLARLWRKREFWDHSVPPHNTTRSTRLFLCVGVTRPLPFLPLRTSYGNESAQTEDLAQASIQEVLHRSRCFAQSSRARGFIRGWIQTAWRIDALPKKVTKEANQVLVRKAPTTLTQSGNSTVDSTQSGYSQTSAPQVKGRGDLQG